MIGENFRLKQEQQPSSFGSSFVAFEGELVETDCSVESSGLEDGTFCNSISSPLLPVLLLRRIRWGLLDPPLKYMYQYCKYNIVINATYYIIKNNIAF